jgi:hypothetical protein
MRPLARGPARGKVAPGSAGRGQQVGTAWQDPATPLHGAAPAVPLAPQASGASWPSGVRRACVQGQQGAASTAPPTGPGRGPSKASTRGDTWRPSCYAHAILNEASGISFRQCRFRSRHRGKPRLSLAPRLQDKIHDTDAPVAHLKSAVPLMGIDPLGRAGPGLPVVVQCRAGTAQRGGSPCRTRAARPPLAFREGGARPAGRLSHIPIHALYLCGNSAPSSPSNSVTERRARCGSAVAGQ